MALYAVLFGSLRREARARDASRRAGYLQLSAVLGGLWLLYPIIVLLGPTAPASGPAPPKRPASPVVDLLAKVGYGLLFLAASKRDADGDLERGEVSPAVVSTHAVPSGAGRLHAHQDAEELTARQ